MTHTALPPPPAGWSHFAQFTIAVVNKDPKKSKYSGKASQTLPAIVPIMASSRSCS